MIIVKLTGGIGNQMFQYAAARSLAGHLQADLKLDTSYFRYEKNRNYELHLLQIEEEFSTMAEVFDLVGCRQYYSYDKLFGTNYFYRQIRKQKHFYWQRQFQFDENFFKVTDPAYLEGYWQSEKFFISISDRIRKEFTFRDHFSDDYARIAEIVKDENSVSVHIRRSDYFYNSKLYKLHGLLRSDYYEKAIAEISKKVQNLKIYIFSDDIIWVKQTMKFDFPATFIGENLENTSAHEDMMLMSQCKHNIIANSSFSWWSAWLNNNPGKIVIAPRNWFKANEINTEDVIPDSWTII